MPETHRVEYKRELTPELDLEKEVIAFLNTPEGGFIYIGIDKVGQRVGVTDVDGDMLILGFVAAPPRIELDGQQAAADAAIPKFAAAAADCIRVVAVNDESHAVARFVVFVRAGDPELEAGAER